MGTEALIGPYRIFSQDDVLSSDDLVIKTNTYDLANLFDVSDYLREAYSDNEADYFINAFSGGFSLSLKDLDYYYGQICPVDIPAAPSPAFEVIGQQTTTLPLCGNIKLETGYHVVGDTRVPVIVGKELYCEHAEMTRDEAFIESYGGKHLPGSESWDHQISNCYAYAVHPVLNFPPNIGIGDGIDWNFKVLPDAGHPGNSFLVTDNLGHTLFGIETVLNDFYRPAGFIPSSHVPITELTAIILTANGTTRGMSVLNDTLNKRMDDELNRLVTLGKLDASKAESGEYIIVFAQRVAWEKESGDTSFVMPKHAGILKLENGHWTIEAKLGLAAPVYVSGVGTQALSFEMNTLEDGLDTDMFYRIYEPKQNGQSGGEDFTELLAQEPLARHQLLYRRLTYPSAQAEQLAARLNEAL